MLIIWIFIILLSIAWYTLLERKTLGHTQLRIGPNKIRWIGHLQPILDGLKLILKENHIPYNKILLIYKFSPATAFVLILILWAPLNLTPFFFSFQYACLFILVQIGLIGYTILFRGWGSTSKFASLGSIRIGSQSLSYEIILIFLFLPSFILSNSLSILIFYWKTVLLLIPLLLLWLITILAECNRAPFDFSEGESELISGFNIEYRRVNFTLLFLSEYGSILAFSWITSTLFNAQTWLTFLIVFSFFLFIRTSLPRYRYDMLMQLCWMTILPIRLLFLLLRYII